MFQRYFLPRSIVAFGALLAGAIVLGSGCSSSGGGNGSTDSGSGDMSDSAPVHRGDAGAIMPMGDTGTATGGGLYDGTVGQACKSNADCQPAGGAGVNVCSSSLTGVLFPSPVCVLTGCNPGTDGSLHFCDGPDMPTSPGACFDVGQGQGFCLPQCQLLTDGKAPLGCLPGSACAELALGVDMNGNIAGAFGACFSACVQNADCPSGTTCQVDTGICVTAVVPATKAPGAPCTADDLTHGACECFSGVLADGGLAGGVCAPSCVTGPTAACPSGFICDALLETTVMSPDASTQPGFTVENPGLVGRCFRACSASGGEGGGAPEGDATAGDASPTAAGTCPAPATCQTLETAGADCIP
jgi:hypothetical protein